MKALDGPMPQRAVLALEAGCDLVLHCSGDWAEAKAVLDAVTPISSDSARRISDALERIASPVEADLDNASARLAQLIRAWS